MHWATSIVSHSLKDDVSNMPLAIQLEVHQFDVCILAIAITIVVFLHEVESLHVVHFHLECHNKTPDGSQHL